MERIFIENLGAKNILVYSRIENDNLNPDFITGNKIARVGIIKNPVSFGTTSVLLSQKASNTYAIKLTGNFETASFLPNSRITQTISGVGTAVGRVVSYDNRTGVLKYWQDRSIVGFETGSSSLTYTPEFGLILLDFHLLVEINGASNNLSVDTGFTGFSTTINSMTYNLGQYFQMVCQIQKFKKYSGEMIYIDNRPSITRSCKSKRRYQSYFAILSKNYATRN
jgi:hypothetical protein